MQPFVPGGRTATPPSIRGKGFTLSTAGLESESKSGMTVSLGDAFNEGRLDVFVTNISERAYLFQNNNLRLNRMAEEGRFRNVADAAVADAGWAWGAQFGDLNNDGFNELFVANGFISADPEQNYWYSMSKIAGVIFGMPCVTTFSMALSS